MGRVWGHLPPAPCLPSLREKKSSNNHLSTPHIFSAKEFLSYRVFHLHKPSASFFFVFFQFSIYIIAEAPRGLSQSLHNQVLTRPPDRVTHPGGKVSQWRGMSQAWLRAATFFRHIHTLSSPATVEAWSIWACPFGSSSKWDAWTKRWHLLPMTLLAPRALAGSPISHTFSAASL
jgi:hypothetical protein